MAGKPTTSGSTRGRLSRRRRPTSSKTAQPSAGQSQALSGFNFTEHMRILCVDIVTRTPEMRHINMDYVAVSFNQTRKRVRHGMWASLTPMRFEDGATISIRNGRRYTAQKLYDDQQREMLYILSFYLPRFMQLSFQDKLTTIFHELWHISPDFNGDIRRHPGRCYAHTQSEAEYDARMHELSLKWLALDPTPELYTFLKRKFGELERQYGRVIGSRVKQPKLIPLDNTA